MSKTKIRYPEVMVFAGPNGSGKTTIKNEITTIGVYINADDIKKEEKCNDIDAAKKAEMLRELMLEKFEDFTFETVLSTDRNLKLLQKAKEKGFFIRCIYVLTSDYKINIARVIMREHKGGHGVPEEKIKSRFQRAFKLIPELVEVCDIIHIYDNTEEPFRIFKKKKSEYYHWENDYWSFSDIENITKISDYDN